MEKILNILSWFIIPIAIPGWLLENIYRRVSKRFWEFNIWSGSFYIIVLVILSFVSLFSNIWILRLIALYVFSALEVLGIFVCASLIFGNVRGYKSTIIRLSRRKREYRFDGEEKLDISDIWIAIASYLYTAFYFAVIGFSINSINSTAYSGVQGENQLEIFFNFVYFSFVSLVALGNVEISPIIVISKLVFMVEITLGILFTLFIFSIIAENVISRRQR